MWNLWQTSEKLLATFAVIAPMGIVVALVVNATLGGWLVLCGLGVGLVGLHRLGRSGPA